MKVLVVRSYLSDWIAKQKDLLPDNVELITPEKGTDEELVRLAQDVDIIVCTRLSAAVVKGAKNLKLIQKTGAGVDALPRRARCRGPRAARTPHGLERRGHPPPPRQRGLHQYLPDEDLELHRHRRGHGPAQAGRPRLPDARPVAALHLGERHPRIF